MRETLNLPKINHVTLSDKLISNDKPFNYRPFTVGEQKVFLLLKEAIDIPYDQLKNMTAEEVNEKYRKAMQEIAPGLENAVMALTGMDRNEIMKLIEADVTWIFLKSRFIAAGSTVEVSAKCGNPECDNSVNLKLDFANIKAIKEKANDIIKIDDSVSIQLRYLPFFEMLQAPKDVTELEILALAIATIIHDGKVIDLTGYKLGSDANKEIAQWINQFSEKVLDDIEEFYRKEPKITFEYTWKCPKCGHENKIHLEKFSDFFV